MSATLFFTGLHGMNAACTLALLLRTVIRGRSRRSASASCCSVLDQPGVAAMHLTLDLLLLLLLVLPVLLLLQVCPAAACG